MTDLNNEAQELAAVMRQVAQDMAQFGKITAQTAEARRDAEVKAKTGIDNFTAGTNSMASAAGRLVDAHTEAAKAVYNGERGAKAFNKSLDSLTEAAKLAAVGLSVMVPGGPLIKGVVAGLSLLAAKMYELSNEYTKAANVMSDTLFKGFQDMSEAGGSASDGMKGLFEDTKRLGLSMNQLDSFVQLVNSNSRDLALFGGTVFEGRKKFAQMGEAMTPFRESLMNLGMTQEQINAGAMQYLRLQTRIGQSQNMTTQQLAEGARKYLIEQEALAKITGMNRQEQEQALEAARSQQRFRAKLEEMRNSGDANQIAGAKKLEEEYTMLYKYNKKAAEGLGDVATGMIGTEAASQFFMLTMGKGAEVASKLAANQIEVTDGFKVIAGAAKDTTRNLNMLGQTGVFDETFGSFVGGVELGIAGQRDLTKELANARAEIAKQGGVGGKAADAGVAAQVQLTLTQQQANKKLEEFVNAGVVKATEEMITFARRVEFAGRVLGRITESGKFEEGAGGPKSSDAVTQRQMEKAAADVAQLIRDRQAGKVKPGEGGGASFDPNTGEVIIDGSRALGGNVKKGSTYLVGENGPELFVPKIAGDIVPNDTTAAATGASSNKAEQIKDAVESIIIDTKRLEKITDSDTIRVAKFSDLQKKYLEMKTVMLQDQIVDMIEQGKDNKEITDALDKLEKLTAGDLQRSQKYSDLQKRYFESKSNLLTDQIRGLSTGSSSGSAPSASSAPSSGTGLKAPSVSAPSSGAGGAMSQSDLAGLGLKIKAGDVQAEGAGISPKIISLAEQVQANMPDFAYFSGFNDKFHQEKSPSSFHTKGQAMDFALSRAPSKEEGQEIVNWLKNMGASMAIDEYNNPSSKATAGHIHAQIAGYADGGIAEEPQIAMVAEKGPEAMIPLKNGAIPVEGFAEAVTSLRVMQDRMSEMVMGMTEMLREQRNSNDNLQKIYQVSAN